MKHTHTPSTTMDSDTGCRKQRRHSIVTTWTSYKTPQTGAAFSFYPNPVQTRHSLHHSPSLPVRLPRTKHALPALDLRRSMIPLEVPMNPNRYPEANSTLQRQRRALEGQVLSSRVMTSETRLDPESCSHTPHVIDPLTSLQNQASIRRTSP